MSGSERPACGIEQAQLSVLRVCAVGQALASGRLGVLSAPLTFSPYDGLIRGNPAAGRGGCICFYRELQHHIGQWVILRSLRGATLVVQ